MTTTARKTAAWAVVRALRTGEVTAARIAHGHLSSTVEFAGAQAAFAGIDAVTERLTGLWTYTPVLAAGAWEVIDSDDGVAAIGDFAGIGAAPAAYRLEFRFNEAGQISTIQEIFTPAAPPTPAAGMSPWVRRCLDRALAEGRPVAVTYVDKEGLPSISLRGSLYTIDETRLGLWLRKPTGGLADAIAAGQTIAFLYRDSSTRTTLIGRAAGTIIDDPVARDSIFESTPEVEQRHDPARTGAAAILSLIDLRGTSSRGTILVRAEND